MLFWTVNAVLFIAFLLVGFLKAVWSYNRSQFKNPCFEIKLREGFFLYRSGNIESRWLATHPAVILKLRQE